MNNNFENYINNYFKSFRDNSIKDAMIYSFEGGKRIRPEIIFSIIKGANIDESKAYACALALEMIQTYSLIHDDLPAMDDDDYRRGKLSCHKKFGEDIAILAGDSLLTHSFGVIADSDYDLIVKSKMISSLSKYSGLEGMIYGQLLDLTKSNNLFLVFDNKTSGLFKIACLFASYIIDDKNEKYFIELGSKIGVIFQLQDDLFDVTKSRKEAGKSYSIKDQDKFTALSIYSIDELKDKIDNLFIELNDYLESASFDTRYLKDIINLVKNR